MADEGGCLACVAYKCGLPRTMEMAKHQPACSFGWWLMADADLF
jgi:hypothetical protein